VETKINIMKKCFKCGELKELTEFYKHSQMGDGHLNKCKPCAKTDVKENYVKNSEDESYIEKERKRGRYKYHRLYHGTGKANVESNIRYKFLYPEKKLAHSMSASIKPPELGLERHHWSYNEEHYKDLIFVTKKHHMKAHRFIIYDQERMMYRRCDTNELLDTKEKHQSFIFYCIKNKED
jgi:hypothetical protein